MLPALPHPSRLRAARRTALGTCCWLLVAAPALGFELRIAPPRERGGYVYADARISDPFGERVGESLQRGMPATLELKAELWRKRNGWFDRLETSYQAQVRIQYEAWSNQYRIARPGAPPLRVTGFDSVATVLSRPWALPVARVGDLKPGARYYLVVNAVLKPLSVEDVAEVEGWLSGEVRTQRGAGLGVITELPRSLFDAVRNFAGFGDQRTRAVSATFDLDDLFP